MASKKPNTKFAKTVQYFEFVDEKSSKFWEISVAECRVDVRYGKIGTTGQSQTKEFGDATAASVHANKLVLEKLAKGYSKVEASGVAVAKPPPRPVNGSAAIVDPTAQLVAAKNPQTSSAVLEMLASGDRELVLLAVAENAATSVATRTLAFQKLIDRDVFIRKVASNPLTPPSLLEVLAGHKVDEVRADVAANTATPEGALALLATDKGRYVRRSVAKNRSTPARALQALAKDVDPFVSGCAASNPSVPVEILLKLAKSKQAHVRAGVAFNRVTPKQILELLAKDDDLKVKKLAQMALKALPGRSARAAVRAASEEGAPLKQKKASTSVTATEHKKKSQSEKEQPAKTRFPIASSELIFSRSSKTQKQIARANKLKQSIIEDTKVYFPDVLAPEMAKSNERRFLKHIELAAEQYDASFQACSPDAVDRAASMLSGPFFTSKKHPIPKAKSEMLYPIVQLDLRIASSLAGETIGDGLLQLWYDVNAYTGLVRVIPRQDVIVSDATEFRFVPAQKFDGFPLPNGWNSDPIGEVVQIMTAFDSIGLASQEEYWRLYLDDADEYEVPDELYELGKKFEQLTNVTGSSRLQLFGSFYPIQYSAVDVGKKCLFSIRDDWGSAGGAQVFYEIAKNGSPSFVFWDCLR